MDKMDNWCQWWMDGCVGGWGWVTDRSGSELVVR